MSNSKLKNSNAQAQVSTRASTSLAGKLSTMAAAANSGGAAGLPAQEVAGTICMEQLVAELAKQRAGLKDDVSCLIQESLKPIQTAMNALRDTVGSFQTRLTTIETVAGENFERLTAIETTIKSLQNQIQALLDRVDDIENRTRRSNLRILNIPEGSETGKDPVKLISELLMECMPEVFTEPPELESSSIARLKAKHRETSKTFHNPLSPFPAKRGSSPVG